MVRDPSGKPAPGVLVSFHPGQYPNAPEYFETKSDQNGRFVVLLQYGRNGRQPWFGPANLTNCVFARDLRGNLAAIQDFTEMPTNLELKLQPGITFSGSVQDAEGAPITNATVDLRMLSSGMFLELLPQPAEVDAKGSFTLPAFPQAGEYFFVNGVTAKGYGAAGAMVEAKDSKTNHYEFPAFVLKRANRKLAGQVLGQDGNPVAGAMVRFYGQGQPPPWSQLIIAAPSGTRVNIRGQVKPLPPGIHSDIQSDLQGRFSFDPVCEGPVAVYANLNSSQGNTSAQGGDTNIVIKLDLNGFPVIGQDGAAPRLTNALPASSPKLRQP